MTRSDSQQISVPATLDVQAVEQALNQLWGQQAGAVSLDEEEGAVMRARVLNLMVYVATRAALGEVEEALAEVTAAHPCRALVMLAEDAGGTDKDIEMFISSHCQADARAGNERHLCCEQVTLIAGGRFRVELPSAATPLLVSDLPVFLWWRDAPRLNDQIFDRLSRASDRVVLDSADFPRPYDDLLALAALLRRGGATDAAISDLNWARLTSWRTLLASFYDVHEYRAALDRISRVRVEYVRSDAAAAAAGAIAPKALILAGWLASRLGWSPAPEPSRAAGTEEDSHLFLMDKGGHRVNVEFQPVERAATMRGWIARVVLTAEAEPQSTFVVSRSEDGRYLETRAVSGEGTRATRTLTGGDKSEAELLGRELEILSHDRIYEEAVDAAAGMLVSASTGSAG